MAAKFPRDLCMWLPTVTLTCRMTGGLFLPCTARENLLIFTVIKQMSKHSSFHLQSIPSYPPVRLWVFHGQFSIPERFLLIMAPIIRGHCPLISQFRSGDPNYIQQQIRQNVKEDQSAGTIALHTNRKQERLGPTVRMINSSASERNDA